MKQKIANYIALGLVGLTLLLLCAMGVVASITGGVGVINQILKIAMYAVFILSVAAFIVAYIFELRRKRNDRR